MSGKHILFAFKSKSEKEMNTSNGWIKEIKTDFLCRKWLITGKWNTPFSISLCVCVLSHWGIMMKSSLLTFVGHVRQIYHESKRDTIVASETLHVDTATFDDVCVAMIYENLCKTNNSSFSKFNFIPFVVWSFKTLNFLSFLFTFLITLLHYQKWFDFSNDIYIVSMIVFEVKKWF